MGTIPTVTTAVNTVEAGKHYQVQGSKGNWYDVAVQADGRLLCNCIAGSYRKACKHTPQVEAVLAADNWQAFATRVNARAVAAGIVDAGRVEVEAAAARNARAKLAAGQTVNTYKLGDGSTYTASSIADELCAA